MGLAVLFLPVWIWIRESPPSFLHFGRTDRFNLIVRPLQFPNKNVVPRGGYLVRIPYLPHSITSTSQVLLPQRNCVLHPRDIHFDCRGEEEGSCSNDVTPLHRDRSHVTLLRLELHQGWMCYHAPYGHLRRSTPGTFPLHICAFSFVISLSFSDARATMQVAKMTNYMGGGLFCDTIFGLFMATWLVTRHILFTLVIVSIYADVPKYCQFKWDPANGYYVTNNVYIGFLVLMGLLQVRQVPYFRHIFKSHERPCASYFNWSGSRLF